MLSLGTSEIGAVRLGADEIAAIYLGSEEIWSLGGAPKVIGTPQGFTGAAASATIDLDTSSMQAGDLLVMIVSCDGSRTISNTGATWTAIAMSNTDPSMAVYVGNYGEVETSFTLSFGGSEDYAVGVYTIRGAVSVLPRMTYASPQNSTGASADLSSLTSPYTDQPHLWLALFSTAGGTLATPPSGWTANSWSTGTAGTNAGAHGMYIPLNSVSTMDPAPLSWSASMAWRGTLLAIPGKKVGLGSPSLPARMERDSTTATFSSTTPWPIHGMVVPSGYPNTKSPRSGIIEVGQSGAVRVTAQVVVRYSSYTYQPVLRLMHNNTILQELSGSYSGQLNPQTHTFATQDIAVAPGDVIWLSAHCGSAGSFIVTTGSDTYLQVVSL